MKGLFISLVVILFITAASFGAAVIMHLNLVDSLQTARERGFDEGYGDGYEEGLVEGGIAGYQEGSKVGYLESNRPAASADPGEGFYFIYNPTYKEVQSILDAGGLDTAKAVIDYCVSNGIRVAYVRCQIVPDASSGTIYLRELVGFETVDNGMVIADPELRREVRVETGSSYSEINGIPAYSYDDTIGKITIVW
jgi:hypothetical protein